MHKTPVDPHCCYPYCRPAPRPSPARLARPWRATAAEAKFDTGARPHHRQGDW